MFDKNTVSHCERSDVGWVNRVNLWEPMTNCNVKRTSSVVPHRIPRVKISQSFTKHILDNKNYFFLFFCVVLPLDLYLLRSNLLFFRFALDAVLDGDLALIKFFKHSGWVITCCVKCKSQRILPFGYRN